MGKFVIGTRKNGEYQFVLKASNGQVILASEGYTTKASCKNGIESVKKHAVGAENFQKDVSSNKKFYFSLVAKNGQTIGHSEMYETEASRDNGIASVMKNSVDATIEDI